MWGVLLLLVFMTAPRPAVDITTKAERAGENIIYTIAVKNPGPDTATNIIVTHELPAGSSLVSTSLPNVCSGARKVTCAFPSFPAGVTLTFQVVAKQHG
jgi:uncharacterized repeat protein (TIGR01451 family)